MRFRGFILLALSQAQFFRRTEFQQVNTRWKRYVRFEKLQVSFIVDLRGETLHDVRPLGGEFLIGLVKGQRTLRLARDNDGNPLKTIYLYETRQLLFINGFPLRYVKQDPFFQNIPPPSAKRSELTVISPFSQPTQSDMSRYSV